MMFAAVLSDLDGVLIDSVAATAAAWTRWGERHGLDGAAIQAASHGVPARALIAKHVPAAAVAAEAARVLEAEVATADRVVPYAGAAAVLALPVVAIVTSCEAPLARARLDAAGLAAPTVVVPADAVEHGKPAPDAYLLAADRLGVDPADCLVLEDAPAGVTAGKAAGMSVWAVTTTHGADELGDADRVFGGLAELVAALSV
jgi:sugar-phosphatase